MNHQYLAPGQQVIVVGSDKKTHKGKIIDVINRDVARIEYEGGIGVLSCSDEKEPNTFHFEQASPKEEHKKH
jgi:hypothetical protein